MFVQYFKWNSTTNSYFLLHCTYATLNESYISHSLGRAWALSVSELGIPGTIYKTIGTIYKTIYMNPLYNMMCNEEIRT